MLPQSSRLKSLLSYSIYQGRVLWFPRCSALLSGSQRPQTSGVKCIQISLYHRDAHSLSIELEELTQRERTSSVLFLQSSQYLRGEPDGRGICVKYRRPRYKINIFYIAQNPPIWLTSSICNRGHRHPCDPGWSNSPSPSFRALAKPPCVARPHSRRRIRISLWRILVLE